MGQMRYRELLRGQIFTSGTIYTWDTTYAKLLIKDNLEALAQVTVETALTNTLTAHSTWTITDTFDFIYPFKYEYTTVLDGVVRGNLQMYLALNWNDQADVDARTWGKATISLIAITEAGVETVLASGDTSEGYVESVGFDIVNTTVDLPYWFTVDNGIIPNDTRLVMRIVTKMKQTWTSADNTLLARSSAKLNSALNSNDIMVEIPIVA